MQFRQLIEPFAVTSMDVEGNISTFSPELLGLKSEKYGDYLLGNINTDRIVDLPGRQNLANMRGLLAAVGNMSTEGPALQTAKTHLAELIDEEYVSSRSVLDTGAPANMMQVMAARNASGARARESPMRGDVHSTNTSNRCRTAGV